MDKNKIKIVIADDHPLFRSGLVKMIESDNEIEIIGEAENGEIAFNMIIDLKPDIALLDIDMPKMDGLQVIKELNKKEFTVKTIFLTVYDDESIFDEAMDNGITGYVLKDSAINDITDCIKEVSKGNYYISPSLSNFLINRKEKNKRHEDSTPAISKLTITELKVLNLVSEGKTSRQIGEELLISHKTVENHKSNISEKLGIKGSHSLMKIAIENRSNL